MSKSFKRNKTYDDHEDRNYEVKAKKQKFQDRREQKRQQRALKIKNIDDLVRNFD